MKRNGLALAAVATVATAGAGALVFGREASPQPAAQAGMARASVADGDTLTIGERTIRVWGVDAPESGQSCEDPVGRSWRCGHEAARALSNHIGSQAVACQAVEQDRYGREVARCMVAGADLGGWLVRSGWAFDYAVYSHGRYADDQQGARSAKAGIWRGRVQPPWEWRSAERDRRTTSATVATPNDPACLLKGNVNAAGRRIVHAPGQRDYEATRIDPAAGEGWFCSIEEAMVAGWRPAAR